MPGSRCWPSPPRESPSGPGSRRGDRPFFVKNKMFSWQIIYVGRNTNLVSLFGDDAVGLPALFDAVPLFAPEKLPPDLLHRRAGGSAANLLRNTNFPHSFLLFLKKILYFPGKRRWRLRLRKDLTGPSSLKRQNSTISPLSQSSYFPCCNYRDYNYHYM